ncbi:MAG: class I SAM-dependent RNA methyltransferase [Pseudomonadota bacterium]
MTTPPTPPLDIYLIATPGLEHWVLDEARAQGFNARGAGPGGVAVTGTWADVWRANLCLRGPTRVLVRLGSFRAMHLAQLDKRSKKFPWLDTLRPDIPVKVEVTCRKSRIYHAGAATQRISGGLVHAGITVSDTAALTIKARIEDDLCTFSIDTSGDPLHKRGHKQAMGKAPLRETMAAMLLRACGYDGSEPLVDPMCGSGTFPIEAAEIAMGLAPGRSRSFAFQDLASFDERSWHDLHTPQQRETATQFYGFDRDAGAVRMATENAERAGVADQVTIRQGALSDLTPPTDHPGLVMMNPPYGARIGNKKLLFALYGTMGKVMKERFRGWRVGMITSDAGLASACNLPFFPKDAPIAHGGLKVHLYQTPPL